MNLVHANLHQPGPGGLLVRHHRHPARRARSLRDAADDNLNAFDPFPPGHTGELNDQDYYDAAGALILPVDRMRRYVTPADINGTGSVVTLDVHGTRRGGRPAGQGPLLQLLSSPRLARIDRLVAEHGDPSPNHWHPRRDLLSVERNRQQLLLYERAEQQPGSASPGICTGLSDIPARRDQ